MGQIRVPLHGAIGKFAVIERDATVGAKIGTNLYAADGSLFDPATFVAQVIQEQVFTSTTGFPATGQGVVLWASVQNIPVNITQAANLSGEGFIRRDSDGAWSASPIVNVDLSGATTDGLAEGSTNLYYTDARVDARIALADEGDQRIDAYGDLRIAADGSLRITP